jgi:hypothetical protein
MEINEFLKAVNEINKANEMAFHYAASILKDFKNLTPAGRSLMADTLMNLISGKRDEPDIKTHNLKGWRNMKIRNVNGTSQNKCNCGSWLKHWENFSKQKANFCPVKNCLEMDLIGAHVQKDDSKDENWYIYPLCKKHNATKEKSLEVSDIYNFVSANVRETCG